MKYLHAVCLVVVLITVLIVGLTGPSCAKPAPPPEEEAPPPPPEEEAPVPPQVFELSWVTMNPPSTDEWGESRHKEAWANWIEHESGGRIKITFYYSASLAPVGEEYSAVKSGIADIGEQYTEFIPGRFPLNGVVTLPWIVDWPGATQAGLAHMHLYDKFPALQEEFKDVKLLFFWYGGPTEIQTVTKPVHTLEDLKGLSQITVGPYSKDVMKLFGAVPQSFPPVENYDAMAKGVADGINVNWAACRVFGYMELIKYSTQVGLTQPGYFSCVMNLDTWNALPADLKELFSGENCLEWAKVYGVFSDLNDKGSRAAMNKKFQEQGLPEIYVLPDSERERWQEITMPIKQKWVEKVNTLGLSVSGETILDEALKLVQEHKWDPSLEKELKELVVSWEAAGH
jgi:TRAP-type C4-dicarboxylate transport system substrate-binding protein